MASSDGARRFTDNSTDSGPSAHRNSFSFLRLEMEARVGIGLGEADFYGENSLNLLVIQHFGGTILQDGFTMVC